jgi:tetratricopeptide (TPR) repeat protein
LAPHAIFNAAISAKQTKQGDLALQLFEKLRKEYASDPLADEAAMHSGILLEALGRNEEALAAYAQAEQLPKETLAVEAAYDRSQLLANMKRYDEAIAGFNALTVKYPKQDQWVVTAFARMAECHEAKGEYKQAADVYNRIIKYTGVKAWKDSARKRLAAIQKYLPKPAPAPAKGKKAVKPKTTEKAKTTVKAKAPVKTKAPVKNKKPAVDTEGGNP